MRTPGLVNCLMTLMCCCYCTGGLSASGGEESCPSVESVVNWLLEHEDTWPGELSDDSDVLLSYIDESWSDHESVLMDDVPDDEVAAAAAASLLICFC